MELTGFERDMLAGIPDGGGGVFTGLCDAQGFVAYEG